MSAWKAGKIQWFNPDKEEGIVVDTEDGKLYYLDTSVTKKLQEMKGRKKGRTVRYKTECDYRATKVSELKLGN